MHGINDLVHSMCRTAHQLVRNIVVQQLRSLQVET